MLEVVDLAAEKRGYFSRFMTSEWCYTYALVSVHKSQKWKKK